ncbi:hypothetical protein BC829DRAFT_419871 [Chytridium lagenaria]|nr:hypothetical protein BC829DRAFT_419871 [Chytridium lagenaria]
MTIKASSRVRAYAPVGGSIPQFSFGYQPTASRKHRLQQIGCALSTTIPHKALPTLDSNIVAIDDNSRYTLVLGGVRSWSRRVNRWVTTIFTSGGRDRWEFIGDRLMEEVEGSREWRVAKFEKTEGQSWR